MKNKIMLRSKKVNDFLWAYTEKVMRKEILISNQMVKAEIDGLKETTYYSMLKFNISIYHLLVEIMKELCRRTSPKFIW